MKRRKIKYYQVTEWLRWCYYGLVITKELGLWGAIDLNGLADAIKQLPL